MFTIPSHGWCQWHCYTHIIQDSTMSCWQRLHPLLGRMPKNRGLPPRMNIGTDSSVDLEYHVGITMPLAPPIFLGMVNIPTIELMMTGRWFMKLLYPQYTNIYWHTGTLHCNSFLTMPFSDASLDMVLADSWMWSWSSGRTRFFFEFTPGPTTATSSKCWAGSQTTPIFLWCWRNAWGVNCGS